eukprot:gene11074-12333_t
MLRHIHTSLVRSSSVSASIKRIWRPITSGTAKRTGDDWLMRLMAAAKDSGHSEALTKVFQEGKTDHALTLEVLDIMLYGYSRLDELRNCKRLLSSALEEVRPAYSPSARFDKVLIKNHHSGKFDREYLRRNYLPESGEVSSAASLLGFLTAEGFDAVTLSLSHWKWALPNDKPLPTKFVVYLLAGLASRQSYGQASQLFHFLLDQHPRPQASLSSPPQGLPSLGHALYFGLQPKLEYDETTLQRLAALYAHRSARKAPPSHAAEILSAARKAGLVEGDDGFSLFFSPSTTVLSQAIKALPEMAAVDFHLASAFLEEAVSVALARDPVDLVPHLLQTYSQCSGAIKEEELKAVAQQVVQRSQAALIVVLNRRGKQARALEVWDQCWQDIREQEGDLSHQLFNAGARVLSESCRVDDLLSLMTSYRQQVLRDE